MRPTFLLNSDCKPVSALASKAEPHALHVGLRVSLARDFETPWGIVPAGSKGHVSFVDELTGSIDILIEGTLPALYHWQDTLVLVPWETDDLASILVAHLRHLIEIDGRLLLRVNPPENVTQLRKD
jgi:hypothetical protein